MHINQEKDKIFKQIIIHRSKKQLSLQKSQTMNSYQVIKKYWVAFISHNKHLCYTSCREKNSTILRVSISSILQMKKLRDKGSAQKKWKSQEWHPQGVAPKCKLLPFTEHSFLADYISDFIRMEIALSKGAIFVTW